MKPTIADFRDAIELSLPGRGKFPINKKIKDVLFVLMDKHKCHLRPLRKDCLYYFFQKGHYQRYDETRSGFATYVAYHVYYFLLQELERLDEELEKKKGLKELKEELIEEHITEFSRRRKIVFKDKERELDKLSRRKVSTKNIDWITDIEEQNPEVIFMQKELLGLMSKFFDVYGYDPIYYELMIGAVSIKNAAKEINISRWTIQRNLVKVGAEMRGYLEQHGYNYHDAYELLVKFS